MEKECSERRDIVRTEQERDNDCFKPCKYRRGKTVVSTVNNKTIIVFQDQHVEDYRNNGLFEAGEETGQHIS